MLGSDGSYYGPADLAALNQWATEGRILADTVLVEQGTNRQLTARNLPGLQHHFQLAPPPKYQPPPGAQTPYGPAGQNWQNPPPPSGLPRQLGYRAPVAGHYVGPRKSKLAAALLAFLVGFLGIHRFYLGYTGVGFAILGIFIFGYFVCCFIGPSIACVIAIIDGVMILVDQLPDANGQSLE